MGSHVDNWVVPATGDYIAVCGGGGASGFLGQNTPYRGGGGGSGARASRLAHEIAASVIQLLIPDPGAHGNLDAGSQAEYGRAGTSATPCTAAGGSPPGFFGPIGLGGQAAACTGDVIDAGTDGDGPVPDLSSGPGHNGGASPDGTPGGLGGAVDDVAGGQDGPSPGGGGGGGGSMTAIFANTYSACSGGYVIIYKLSAWSTYPAGSPTAPPIAVFGTPPPLPPAATFKPRSFVA